MRRASHSWLLTLILAATAVVAAPGPSGGLAETVIRGVAAGISPESINDTVRTLAGFGTRGNYSNPAQTNRGIGAARRWIFSKFQNASPRLQVSLDSTKQGATEIVNVVAVLPGDGQPEKRIIVGGHYDSINLRDKSPEAPAPGADDDASGTAVVLELARVMSRYRFRRTIVFVAFGGEEIGLVGSSHYAARAKAAGEQIEAVFNNDIVGSNVIGVTHNDIDGSDDTTGSDGDTGNRLRVYSPGPVDSASRQLAKYVRDSARRYVPVLNLDMILSADRYDRAGDQVSFQKNGYAAVRFTSASESTDVQHTANDTPAGVSAEFTAEVARVNAAAIAGLAMPN